MRIVGVAIGLLTVSSFALGDPPGFPGGGYGSIQSWALPPPPTPNPTPPPTPNPTPPPTPNPTPPPTPNPTAAPTYTLLCGVSGQHNPGNCAGSPSNTTTNSSFDGCMNWCNGLNSEGCEYSTVNQVCRSFNAYTGRVFNGSSSIGVFCSDCQYTPTPQPTNPPPTPNPTVPPTPEPTTVPPTPEPTDAPVTYAESLGCSALPELKFEQVWENVNGRHHVDFEFGTMQFAVTGSSGGGVTVLLMNAGDVPTSGDFTEGNAGGGAELYIGSDTEPVLHISDCLGCEPSQIVILDNGLIKEAEWTEVWVNVVGNTITIGTGIEVGNNTLLTHTLTGSRNTINRAIFSTGYGDLECV